MLSLKHCLVEPEQVHKFLSSFDSLVTFEYTDGGGARNDTRPNSNIFRIYNSLEYHARHSMRRLTLRGLAGAPLTPVSSLHNLEALEELNVDNLLCCVPETSALEGCRSFYLNRSEEL